MKNIRISFGAAGYVTQDIAVSDEVDAEDLVNKLNSGDWATTIQEGGNLEVVASGEIIGKVVYVENSLEYDEFATEVESLDAV
jgi:hypothetical protein